MVAHANRAHAVLSASGAKRWLACPPSARLEEKFPSKNTAYTLEGTRAHEIAETELRQYFTPTPRSKKAKYEGEDARIYDEVLHYIDSIKELYVQLKKENQAVEVFFETRLDFSSYVPEGFGTGDVIMLADNTLYVIDLKFGKGVKVEAQDNPQLRLYGLGAINEFEDLFDFEKVVMKIVQPRLDHESSEELSVKELLKWGEEIKPIATSAYEGKGDYAPGDHCRFCRASGCCRALTEYSISALDEAPDPCLVGLEEIGQYLERIPAIEHWMKAVKTYATEQALTGEKVAGWKIVEGRSVRKYSDEMDIVDALHKAGYEDALIFEKKLYGITAMEKMMGKKRFSEVLGKLIIKPEGAPTLVPESDKRPEFKPQQALIDAIEVPDEI